MAWLNKTGYEYDVEKEKAKLAKAEGRKKEARKLKRMNRRELDAFKAALIRAKASDAIDSAGRIKVKSAFEKVREYKKRMRNGQCPTCGAGLDLKPGKHATHLCAACLRVTGLLPSVDATRVKMGNHTQGIAGIPDGQNMNGIVYCSSNTHRCWLDHNGLPVKSCSC